MACVDREGGIEEEEAKDVADLTIRRAMGGLVGPCFGGHVVNMVKKSGIWVGREVVWC